jgi:hypothetical protein
MVSTIINSWKICYRALYQAPQPLRVEDINTKQLLSMTLGNIIVVVVVVVEGDSWVEDINPLKSNDL